MEFLTLHILENLSSLSLYEYAILRASIEAKWEKRFNCYLCVGKWGKNKARFEAKKKSMGCEESMGRVYNLDNINYYKCIGNFQDNIVNYYIEEFLEYEKGRYPYPGNMGDQPNKIIEIFNVIEQVRRDKSKKE